MELSVKSCAVIVKRDHRWDGNIIPDELPRDKSNHTLLCSESINILPLSLVVALHLISYLSQSDILCGSDHLERRTKTSFVGTLTPFIFVNVSRIGSYSEEMSNEWLRHMKYHPKFCDDSDSFEFYARMNRLYL